MARQIYEQSEETLAAPKPRRSDSPRNFWLTTGCATIVAALIGAGATALSLAAKDNNPNPPSTPLATQTSHTPSANQVEKASTNSAITATNTQPMTGIRWQGNFALTSYPDFDTIPPTNDSGGSLAQDIYGTLHTMGHGAAWTSAGPPTRQQCSDQVDTQSQDSIPVNVGTQVCFKTGSGLVVYFKVVAISSDTNSYRYQTAMTIWDH